jgi:hypothetical protein
MEGKRNKSVEILRECEKIDLVKWIVSPLKIREINYYKYLVFKKLGNTKKSKSCLNEAKKIILELADSINNKGLKLNFLKNNNTNNTILSE